MDLGLEDKVALVTGAGSGIGKGTALLFADEGAMVAVVDVDRERGQETVREIELKGGKAAFFDCDVASDSQVKAMVEAVVRKFGHVDCAFNNAGIEGQSLPIVDYDEEVWDQIIDINLKGVWLCMKYEIPQMVSQGGGAIVNSGSVASLMGTPGATGYTATKHGVLGLTRTAALENAQTGVRINAICPGAIHTGLTERVIRQAPWMEKFYADTHPIGRMGRVEEIAGAVVWMCSPWASFMIGQGMVIDGGLTVP